MTVRKATKYLIIHCSATRPSVLAGAKEIDKWHKAQGWSKIGYHHVVRRDGTIETGRLINQVGAHAVGPTPKGEVPSKNWWNENSVALCWEGGINENTLKPEDNRTPEQVAAIVKYVNDTKKSYPGIQVIGHRDVPGVKKACPCFDVKAFVKEHSL